MSELSVSAGSEGYGACDDAGDWGAPQQAETARSRKAGAERFFASVCALALLAGLLTFHETSIRRTRKFPLFYKLIQYSRSSLKRSIAKRSVIPEI